MFYLNNCSLLKYTALILYTSLAVILLSENTTAQSRFIWVSQSSKHDIENGTKKNPFKKIQSAVDSASEGTIIRIRPGVYAENVILTGDVKLKGNRKFKSVVTPLDFNKPIITIRGQNSLSNLKIIDGLIGVKVEADALVKIHNCKILNNINDGVLADAPLEGEAPATINIVNSLISKNGDGVDLEASRGSIRNSRLCNQLDDAIDYDGNSNFSVYNNTICNNRDDGIEIRLASSTTGIIKGNRIFGNGEDGIEVIDTSEVNTNNLILIRRNKVFRNARYGISGVDHDLEDAIQGNIVDEILAKRNRIRKNGIAQIIGIE